MAGIVDRQERRCEGVRFFLFRLVIRASASCRVYEDGRDDCRLFAIDLVSLCRLNFGLSYGDVMPVVNDLGAWFEVRARLINVGRMFVVFI